MAFPNIRGAHHSGRRAGLRGVGSKGFFLRLAGKNLTRYRRRTVITASAIAFGVAIFIAMQSMLAGFSGESDRNFARYETGTAAVTGAGYWDERDQHPLDILVEEPQQVLRAWEEAGIPATARTSFRGELIIYFDPFPEDGSLPATFVGVDVERDSDVFDLEDSIVEGRWLESGEDGVIIGRWLAERLGAEVGYPVTVTARTRDGFHQIVDLEIVGIFDTPNPVINRSSLYLPIETVDFYLEMRGAVTSVHALIPGALPSDADPSEARTAVDGIAGIDFLTFADLNQEMIEMMEVEDASMNLVLFLLGIIAVVGISNTMLMAVLEREREIGMMRALGVRNREIRRMFMYEAAGIGVLGSLIGVALGAVLVHLLVEYGIDYGTLMEGLEMDFRIGDVMYGVWDVPVMLLAALGATTIASLVAIVPVRRILKRRITESLHHS